MKLKLLVNVIYLIFFVNSVSCEKLSDAENFQRTFTCGQQKLPIPNNGDIFLMEQESWLTVIRISTKVKGVIPHWSLGSFISPRHIITSAQPFIDENQQWTVDGKQINMETGCKGNGILEVPDKYMESLRVFNTYCPTNECNKTYIPIKAWIIGRCDIEDYRTWSTPMIIETKEAVGSFACIPSAGMSDLTEGEKMHVYRIDQTAELEFDLYYEQKTFKRYNPPLFLTFDLSERNDDKGGPVLREVGGKQYVYGARAGQDDQESKFYDIRTSENLTVYGSQLCEVAGICHVSLPNWIPWQMPSNNTASTTNSPSTEAPSTVTPTSMTPRTTGPSSEAPKTAAPNTIAPKTIAPTTTAPQTTPSAGIEHESELEKVPKKKKKKPFVYRVEPDIYVSADFLDDSEQKKWGFVLIFVLVVWVL